MSAFRMPPRARSALSGLEAAERRAAVDAAEVRQLRGVHPSSFTGQVLGLLDGSDEIDDFLRRRPTATRGCIARGSWTL